MNEMCLDDFILMHKDIPVAKVTMDSDMGRLVTLKEVYNKEHEICMRTEFRNGESVAEWIIRGCEEVGISREMIVKLFGQTFLLDSIIANIDRHFQNMGFMCNPDTLEFIGPAKIFDSGASLWYDSNFKNRYGSFEREIYSSENKNVKMEDQIFHPNAKPFAGEQGEQLRKLKKAGVNFNEYFSKRALRGVEEEADIILKTAELDEKRHAAVINGIEKRIKLTEKAINGR